MFEVTRRLALGAPIMLAVAGCGAMYRANVTVTRNPNMPPGDDSFVSSLCQNSAIIAGANFDPRNYIGGRVTYPSSHQEASNFAYANCMRREGYYVKVRPGETDAEAIQAGNINYNSLAKSRLENQRREEREWRDHEFWRCFAAVGTHEQRVNMGCQ